RASGGVLMVKRRNKSNLIPGASSNIRPKQTKKAHWKKGGTYTLVNGKELTIWHCPQCGDMYPEPYDECPNCKTKLNKE
ncbi:MAG: hypothetical protein PHN80_16380, partial [Hespellia sp.]|nr:hypothetical protein [Hespellia sp.]